MDTDGDAGGTVNELTVLLAGHPSAITQLLAVHVDDGTGHCALCSAGPQAGRMLWPCRLQQLAAGAQNHAARDRGRRS